MRKGKTAIFRWVQAICLMLLFLATGAAAGYGAGTDPAPYIESVNPADQSVGVSVDTKIVITLSETVRNAGAENWPLRSDNVQYRVGLRTLDANGAYVGYVATMAVVNSKTVITITPNKRLLNNQVYYVSVNGLEDSADQLLSGRISTTFTTAMGTAVYDVKKYGAKGDGVTDDTVAIQALLDYAQDGETVLFTKGTYLTKKLTVRNEINLLGYDGATLQLAPESDKALEWSAIWISDGYSLLAPVSKGDRTIRINKVRGLRVGDIVAIRTQKSAFTDSTLYKAGTVKYITAIDPVTGTLTLDAPLEYSYALSDIDKVVLYEGYNNISVKGITIRLNQDGRQFGLYGVNMTHSRIQSVRVIGGGLNEIGILLGRSFASEIFDANCSGFLDRSKGLGYGIQISGHGLTVRESRFTNCKHGIVGSENEYYCSGLNYIQNIATNCIAAFDYHDNVSYSRMEGNTVNGLGYYSDSAGIWDRGSNNVITGNIVNGIRGNNCTAIKIINHGSPNTEVTNNKIYGVNFGITFDELVISPNGFKVNGNYIQAKTPLVYRSGLTSTAYGIGTNQLVLLN